MRFEEYDFSVERIDFACRVWRGTPIHRDRPTHGVVLRTRGRGRYAFESGELLVQEEGDILYLPRGSSYTVSDTEGGECYAINFTLSEDVAFPPFLMRVKNREIVLDAFRRADLAFSAKRNGYLLKCKAELYAILYAICRERQSGYLPKSRSNKINLSLDEIRRRYTDPALRVSEIAEQAGMGESYFRRLFRQVMGVGPTEYICSLRLVRAKELLENGMHTVTEVSTLSGYSDACYFSREFKRRVGVSPSEYALTHR